MNAKLSALLFLILALGGVVYWQKTRGPVATIDPMPQYSSAPKKQWIGVGELVALDTSFQVRGWLAFSAAASADAPKNVKTTIVGEFAADSPALLLLMDDKNFERLRSGYPPLPLATFEPGHVRKEVPGEKTWLVFCQKPAESSAEPFPTTGLQLGLALLKRLQESNAPAAHVTVHLDSVFSVYATPSDAAALRAKFQTALASARQQQPLPQDRTPHQRPSAAPLLSSPPSVPLPSLVPDPDGHGPPAIPPAPAVRYPTLRPDPQP